MGYEFSSRVRYSETDSNGKLSLLALLNYFQDASTFQSEELGVGLQELYAKGLAWVVSSWQIEVERFPKLCEEIVTGTFPNRFRMFIGERNFYMKDAKGDFLAKANSMWTLVNLKEMKPQVPPEGMIEKYTLEEKLVMEDLPRHIKIPNEQEAKRIEATPFYVSARHLDTNNHVNNGQYIAMAMDYLPRNLEIKRMRAEYKKPAFLGDCIEPEVFETEEGFIVSLTDHQGDAFVNLEFIKA